MLDNGADLLPGRILSIIAGKLRRVRFWETLFGRLAQDKLFSDSWFWRYCF